MQSYQYSYDGDRFRYEVEARWAMFFRKLGIAYEYEKNEFVLDRGWVKPDFYLRKERVWIKVKPKVFEAISPSRYRDLARETGKTVLLIVGKPERCQYFTEAYTPHGWHDMRDGTFAQSAKKHKRLVLVRDQYAVELRSGARISLIEPGQVILDSAWIAKAEREVMDAFR